MNGKLNDIGEELTDSLSRSGKGAMTAALRVPDGSIALPSYTFTNETNLGFYRPSTGVITAVDGSTEIMKWSTAEVRVYAAAVFEDSVEVATGLVIFGGATITQSTSNTAGLTATGNGTGAGVRGVGGATGAGGSFQGGATSGAGINVTGGPSSTGANITGGSGTSAGAVITGSGAGVGAQIAAGTASTGADPTNALELTNGNLKLSGAVPNSNEALANTLTPLNLPKAWVRFLTTGGGSTGTTVTAGFNITSVAVSGTTITITLASAVAATGAAFVTPGNSSSNLVFEATVVGATVTLEARELEISGTAFDLYNFQTGAARAVQVLVFGEQA
jgi:hypothetical protein